MSYQTSGAKTIGRWQLYRRLYNWVLNWAEHKYRPGVMVSIALLQPVFLPIPADLLLVAMCPGKPKTALHYGIWVSVFPEMVAYNRQHFPSTRGRPCNPKAKVFADANHNIQTKRTLGYQDVCEAGTSTPISRYVRLSDANREKEWHN